MSEKEQFSREGTDTFSEVSAFLGGIFFTALLILVQQRSEFDATLFEITLNENLTISITQLLLIAIPLSISIILFVFSSIFFAIACSQVDQGKLAKQANAAGVPFIIGLFSMFVSLVVLVIVHPIVGLLGVIVSVVTFLWWVRVIRKA